MLNLLLFAGRQATLLRVVIYHLHDFIEHSSDAKY